MKGLRLRSRLQRGEAAETGRGSRRPISSASEEAHNGLAGQGEQDP